MHSDQLLPLPPQNPCARAIMAVEAWVEESEPRYTHAKKQPGLPVRSLPYCSSPTYRTRPPSERDNPSPQAADVTAHAAQKRLPMRLISMRLREGPPQTRRPMPAPIRLRPSDCRCGSEAAAEAAPMVPSKLLGNRGEQDVVDGCWFPLCAHAATLMPNLVPLVDNRPDRSGAGCTIEQVGATLSATAEGIMSIRIRRSLCRHPCMHCMPMHAHVCLCSAHACMSMIYAYAPRSQCSACGCARPR